MPRARPPNALDRLGFWKEAKSTPDSAPFLSSLFKMRSASFNTDPYVREFGIMVKDEMTDVTGRVLQPPSILYGGRVGRRLGGVFVGVGSMCLNVDVGAAAPDPHAHALRCRPWSR